MLDDLIIEIESIDTTNLSEQEKVVINEIESFKMIKFDLTRNVIYFYDKDDEIVNWWQLKNNRFRYSHKKIYKILEEKFGYKQQQINDLVKNILLNHYKIKVTITKYSLFL